MLNSKQLRLKARESLKGKYWKAFWVSIVTGIIYSLGVSCISFGESVSQILTMVKPEEMDFTMKLGAQVIAGIAIVSLVIGLILDIFVGSPILIGSCNYYIKNTYSNPSFGSAFAPFKVRYGRNIWTMLVMGIKLILWTLLFVVPGIIKIFEYSIIPYILADDEEISTKDAFKKARAMMKGNKWRLFKLEFSFIGWMLLCVLTLGIGTFFLTPYIEAATAEFYAELKNK